MLATLVPVRDPRERTMGYEVRTHPFYGSAAATVDDEARATLELVRREGLLRLSGGRTLHIPVAPGTVRSGALSGFASADAVFLLASDALEHPETRRALERLATGGFRFGFVGDMLLEPLPDALHDSIVAFDAGALPPLSAVTTVSRLLAARARPVARNVEDRATRERLRSAGVVAFTGRPLPRGRSANGDALQQLMRALTTLAHLADGRPADASFDAKLGADPELAAVVTRAASSAAYGVARVRSLQHALTMLGRDAVIERLIVATAVLLGEASGDSELPLIALRRARILERLATAVDGVGHPRQCILAGLMSVVDVASGIPSCQLVDELTLPPALNDTLTRRVLPLGRLLDAVEAHECGWWADLESRCVQLDIAPAIIGLAWRDGWGWARDEVGSRRTIEN